MMLTPAISASSTSVPEFMSSNAVSTQVFAPPFVYLWPRLCENPALG